MMKTLIALALVLAFGSAAVAMPEPVPRGLSMTAGSAATGIVMGPAEAMDEATYFRPAPSPTAAGRNFPCRMREVLFEKTRIALSCN
jgi:hypothetical protein